MISEVTILYLAVEMWSFQSVLNFVVIIEQRFKRFSPIQQVETRTIAEVREVLEYASQTKTSLTRIMLDNMVVPLSNGDIDVSMLKEAVELINGRFDTEVTPGFICIVCFT